MSFPELIYKLTEFFYTDLWRFLQLIITILLLRGLFGKLGNSIRVFFGSVSEKFKRRTNETEIVEGLEKHLPKVLKNYIESKQKKEKTNAE